MARARHPKAPDLHGAGRRWHENAFPSKQAIGSAASSTAVYPAARRATPPPKTTLARGGLRDTLLEVRPLARMTQKLDIEQLVSFVIETHKRLGDGPALVDAVAALGMTAEEAGSVVSTVRDAYCRTLLYSAGAQPQNFSGDYETDPLFQAALRRFRATGTGGTPLPASASSRTEKVVTRAAVAAAVLVGLLAMGAVVYYVVDLLRASH
jgi:hypothetical protein